MQHIGVLSGRVCAKEFVDAVKHHMLHLLQRRKTHIRLYLIQCMNELGHLLHSMLNGMCSLLLVSDGKQMTTLQHLSYQVKLTGVTCTDNASGYSAVVSLLPIVGVHPAC